MATSEVSVVKVATVVEQGGQGVVRFIGEFSVGAGDYVSGGLDADIVGLGPYADRPAIMQNVRSGTGSGYEYVYNVSTKKLMVFQEAGAEGPLEELPAGAVPAGVTDDTIQFEITVARTIFT